MGQTAYNTSIATFTLPRSPGVAGFSVYRTSISVTLSANDNPEGTTIIITTGSFGVDESSVGVLGTGDTTLFLTNLTPNTAYNLQTRARNFNNLPSSATTVTASTSTLSNPVTVAGFMTAGGIALILAANSADVIVVGGLVIVFFVAGTALQAGVAGVVSQFGSRSFAHYVTAVDFGAAAGPLLGWMALDYWAFESAGLLIGGCVYLAGAAFGGLAIKR